MIRTLIVDDEPLARSRLKRLLSTVRDVEVIAMLENGQQAVDTVKQLEVDLILMDINMPHKNGLLAAREIVEQNEQAPAIIFCTAYDEYALQAFDAHAASYLLKPVDQAQLEQAVRKAASLSQLQLKSLQQASVASADAKLAIQHSGFIENHSVEQILYFRAEAKQVVAGILDAGEVIVYRTLKELESELEGYFVRVHRNTLVNRQRLEKFVRNEQGQVTVELSGCSEPIMVSRRHLPEVKKCFK